MTISDVTLYLITDDKRSAGRDVLDIAAAAVRGGVQCLQFRPWKRSDEEYENTARALREITASHGCLLLLNRRVDIARKIGADGVQIGAGCGNTSKIRADARELIVVYSAHSLREALDAQQAGVDAVTISPLFPTTSSSLPRPPIGIEGAITVANALTIPAFPLGGIDLDRAAALTLAGIRRAAVVSAITESPDVTHAAAAISSILHSGPLPS